MANLTIPRDHQRTIADIGKLNKEEQTSLLVAMRSSQPSLRIGGLITQIEKASKLPSDLVGPIVYLIHSLYSVADYSGRSVNEFAADLIETIHTTSDGEIAELSDEQKRSVVEFLEQALNLPESMGLSAKAQRVASQHERLFLDGEIYTDARTVFQLDDSELHPALTVMAHILRIEFRQDNQEHSTYFALDYDDLVHMQEVIERALKKHEKLRDVLGNTALGVLEPENKT